MIPIYYRGYGMSPERERKAVLLRLKRIEDSFGHRTDDRKREALSRDHDTGCCCKCRMKKVGAVIVQAYMEECLGKTEKESALSRGETLRDLQKAISQFIDRA